ncbi:unnamed protein product [Adineta steineri]|uniref:Uncharacterized protein n=1 Tax=Adineta steineri TaxID=433720 RepID=A0A815EA85_9BILA|nr:unnamed protein product [Adineta steineri]
METYSTDAFDNKENAVVQSLDDNPDRNLPLNEYRSPSVMSRQEKQPVAMYTLGNGYQQIPSKTLPQKSEPKVYYIGSKQTENARSPIKQDMLHRETLLLIQTGKQSDVPIVFLEPQIISQPILYSIIGEKSTPIIDKPIPVNEEQSSPIIYSINDRPRTVDLNTNSIEDPVLYKDKSPTLYSWVGNSYVQDEVIPEPPKTLVPPSPSVYTLIGSPARTSRGTQLGRSSPIEPVPILYTIVDDTSTSTSTSTYKTKEKHSHPPPPSNEPVVYTVEKESNVYKTPILYALVGKQIPPPLEDNRLKLPARKPTPSPPITVSTNKRISRSPERRSNIITEEIIAYPVTKTVYLQQPKESTNPKSELIVTPYNEEERRMRPQIIHQTPTYTNQDQSHRKLATIPKYPSVQLPDYQSPYANRTHKPYREQNYNNNNNTLPAISHNHAQKKERPPLYEPRYRVERHHPYVPLKPITLARYPVNTRSRANLWDNAYQTDDDEEYEQKLNKKNRGYKTDRPRLPWIPVW